MSPIKGSVRRSQLITTYGIGALIPIQDESFMIAGIERWPPAEPDLHEPRLERQLGVTGFRLPPASENASDIPIVRFPRWYSCPKCRKLANYRDLVGSFDQNTCTRCNRVLVPSRFVVVCPKGHIEDFPYSRWVHEGKPSPSDDHDLYLEARGRTASLSDIVVSCSCGAKRSMFGVFESGAFRGIASCQGRRPWLRESDSECGTFIRALQRGASNVWFGVTPSAISIPPWSEGAFQLLNQYWTILKAIPESAIEETIETLGIANRDYSVEDLVAAVRERKGLESGDSFEPASDEEFRRQEFEALSKGNSESSGGQFVAHPEEVPAALGPWIDSVMLVTRLREVRALSGFTRLYPYGGPVEVAALADPAPGWLPGIEVKGEGVFIRFAEDAVAGWEQRDSVVERAASLDERFRARAEEWGRPVDRKITPRLLLAHTAAHALINQLSLDAGYPVASLRERLYVFDDAVGILVYTASTDSAGSMGGLVTQGRSENFEQMLVDAVARSMWCSADPVCAEATPHGADSLNLAACHACALLPETSCELQNSLLDRVLLIGTDHDPECGFLRGIVSAPQPA